VDPQRLVQRVVEQGAMVAELLPQHLLGLGLIELVGGALACSRSRSHSGRVTVPSGAGARDDEASAPCVGCRGITQPSSRITSTPAAGSGAGAGQFSHWPHPGGGASSSGISTAAIQSPAAGAGASGTVDAAVAAVVTVAAAAASCRDPAAMAVPRGGSVVTAALPVTHGALDEHCLVGTDASDLGALAGARAGTVGATLRTQKPKTELRSLEIGAPGKRLLTSRWRSLASSSLRVRQALLWSPSSPSQHSQMPLRCSPTPWPRAPPLLLTAW
jgi:hypothetical protein